MCIYTRTPESRAEQQASTCVCQGRGQEWLTARVGVNVAMGLLEVSNLSLEVTASDCEQSRRSEFCVQGFVSGAWYEGMFLELSSSLVEYFLQPMDFFLHFHLV